MTRTACMVLMAALAAVLLATCASRNVAKPVMQPCVTSEAEAAVLRDRWGIEITSIHLSMRGRMVDFRYKVLDPAKAVTLAKRENKPQLIDQASGSILLVPNTPKLGPLRQSASRLNKGKIYFALFGNTRCIVKPGSKVTVVIGEFRAENLTVQ